MLLIREKALRREEASLREEALEERLFVSEGSLLFRSEERLVRFELAL